MLRQEGVCVSRSLRLWQGRCRCDVVDVNCGDGTVVIHNLVIICNQNHGEHADNFSMSLKHFDLPSLFHIKQRHEATLTAIGQRSG